MPSYPAINDKEFNLLKKIAENCAEIAAGAGPQPPPSAAQWGSIEGNIDDQTDLAAKLALKANLNSPTFANGITVGSSSAKFNSIKSNQVPLNFPSIAAGSSQELTVTVNGVTTSNNVVMIGRPAAPASGIILEAYVSASNTVTVRATNITAAPIDPPSMTIRVAVISFASE